MDMPWNIWRLLVVNDEWTYCMPVTSMMMSGPIVYQLRQ